MGKQVKKPRLSNTCLNVVVGEYLVKGGYLSAAGKLFEESPVVESQLGDLAKKIETLPKVENEILSGRIREATRILNDYDPELLDNDQYLHFYLLHQEFIEMLKEKRVAEALDFAQFNISPKIETNSEMLAQIERSCALLAYDDPENCPFADMTKPTQRQKLLSNVFTSIFNPKDIDIPRAPTAMEDLLLYINWAYDQLDKNQVTYEKKMRFSEMDLEFLQ
ncbi:Glucose-induced degradation protein 8 -like protein [Trichinella sp. T6]|nr:Glucose-induced degradation protein 8 -like protein [Trichinella sp. T6]